ncbi:hypothetical protein JHN63_45165 [Streptomyces sp. MBT65]|nr:hypothetical protein [Streptomyces sp. MBT65]
MPHHRALLDGTDWASLGTARGDGGFLPTVLTRLLDPDPAVQAGAIRELEPVHHQDSFYEATVPVALYIAAILADPTTAASTQATLLEWLGTLAREADDECVAIGERHFNGGYLANYPELRAFRDRRPTFYRAVSLFLDHDDPGVRDAAVVAALPMTEHPDLIRHRSEVGQHARRLLATSTHRSDRGRALAALKKWGQDITDLETPEDVAARDRYAPARSGVGGYADEPPF